MVTTNLDRGGAIQTARRGMLTRMDHFCFSILKVAVGVAFLLMIVSVFLSVALRELGYMVFPWLEEVSGYFVVWSVFLSGAVLARRNEHISVDIFYEHVPPWARTVINFLIGVLGLVLIGYLACLGGGFTYTAFRFDDVSLSGYIPVWIAYVAIPVGLGLTALAYLLWLVDVIRGGGRAERTPTNFEMGASQNGEQG